MKFMILSAEEFKQHTQMHPYTNIFQTVKWGKVRQCLGSEIYYVGIKKGKQILASALIAKTKMLFGYFADINGEMLIDFHDEELLTFFVKALKNFLKNQNVIYLAIIPAIPYQNREYNGQIIENANCRTLQLLKKLGFIHHGFYTGYSNKSPIWLFVKNLEGLNKESVEKSYQKKTKRLIKKAKLTGLHAQELTFDELTIFQQIMESTSKHLNFQIKPLEYFQYIYQILGKKAKFVAVEINFQQYMQLKTTDYKYPPQKIYFARFTRTKKCCTVCGFIS